MYRSWVDRMQAAETNAERHAIRAEMMHTFGRSKDWVYRRLREHGWCSGRKRRGDAGSTRQGEAELKLVSAMIKEGIRADGRAVLPVNVARSILVQNGVDIAVSDSRLRDLLRRGHLDRAALMRPTPAVCLRTEHPNQLHQADPSMALLYYTPGGRQRLVGYDYKNKPALPPGKSHLKLWRYALTDHYSGSVVFRYYQAAGETSANMWDFLLYAWGGKADPLNVMHGLPEMLYWDAGSANTGRAITRALQSLRVHAAPHAPGVARATGQVEKAHHLFEWYLESRLKFQPVGSLDALNELAERFSAAFNANAIPNLDTRLHRMRRVVGARSQLWMRITDDQLRELPDDETCRLLLTLEPETRTLDNRLMLSYRHPREKRAVVYSLYGKPGVHVGMRVQVQPILVDADAIVLVHYELSGERVALELPPLAVDTAGFPVAAPVFGREYRRAPAGEAEKNAGELTLMTYGQSDPPRHAVPFAHREAGGLHAHDYITTDVDITPAPRVGRVEPIARPDHVRPHEILISSVEAAKRITARLGHTPPGLLAHLRTTYPDGVPATEIDTISGAAYAAPEDQRSFKEA